MSSETPAWRKWALFWGGAAALSAIPFAVALSHAVRGPVKLVALFVWFMVYLAYVFVGSARLKAGRIGPVMKRYRRRLAIAMTAYCLILIGSLALSPSP